MTARNADNGLPGTASAPLRAQSHGDMQDFSSEQAGENLRNGDMPSAGKSILAFDHVSFAYGGGSHAGVQDISGGIETGEVILLCGDSGCGKTTITRLANGLAPHYFEGSLQGHVEVAGNDNAHTPLARIARRVGSVFQNPKSQFFTLNVTGELAFACENFEMSPEDIRSRIDGTAGDFRIESLLDRGIAQMSGGQKQRVACASVSTAEPQVLVLDEPSSNLDARSIADLRQIVRLWKKQGKTVLIAEHRLYWLDGLIDRAWYIADGRIAREMSAEQLHDLDVHERQTLGLRPVTGEQIVQTLGLTDRLTSCDETSGGAHSKDGAYRISDFSYTYQGQRVPALHIAGAELPQGMVTAVTGFNGAGKSTFARCLQGLDRRCHGTLIAPSGERLNRKRRLKACFTVLQDVNCELFTESVLYEVLLAQPQERRDAAVDILKQLDLQTYADRHPLSLSGGQKQRVAIAAAVASERPIIIFDEPTSGLDMRHMEQVAALIRRLADMGRTVVVVTHDAEFALAACDRNITISGGSIQDAYDLNAEGSRKLVEALVACAE